MAPPLNPGTYTDREHALKWAKIALRNAKDAIQVLDYVLTLSPFDFAVFLEHLMEVKGVGARRLSILTRRPMQTIRYHLDNTHKGKTASYYFNTWDQLTYTLLKQPTPRRDKDHAQ